MIDPYAHEERLAIQEADGIFVKGENAPCTSVQRLMAHRDRVMADKAAKNYKKFGVDKKTLAGGE